MWNKTTHYLVECPICHVEQVVIVTGKPDQYRKCRNPSCKISFVPAKNLVRLLI